MKISVVIPAFRSAHIIGPTLESVLQQTLRADEILVLDDGSDDETAQFLCGYRPHITVLQQRNQGVACARNALCQRARGDLVAFLDHDDIWHPRYLEVQRNLCNQFPEAVAYFVRHVNFSGADTYEWNKEVEVGDGCAELLEPIRFITSYNGSTNRFGSMSFCCVPKAVLMKLGNEPFHAALSGVDDSYFCTQLPLLGSVAFSPTTVVAYRITEAAQSADRLKAFARWVEVFRLLHQRYKTEADPELLKAFEKAYASRRRAYAKVLMGAGKVNRAREQLWNSLDVRDSVSSIAKSATLLALTYVPRRLQPEWPSVRRKYRDGRGLRP